MHRARFNSDRGKVLDPITEIDVASRFGALRAWDFKVKRQMPVAEDETIDAFMGQVISTELPDPFVFSIAREAIQVAFSGSAIAGEVFGQCDSNVRVHPPVSPLKSGIGKNAFESLVADVTRSDAITMSNHTSHAVIITDNRFAVQRYPQLIFEITEAPEIVVTHMVVDGNAGICNACDGTEQSHATLGNRVLVFEPKIKDIAHEVNLSRRAGLCTSFSFCCILQPFNEAQFACPALAGIGGTKVQIGGEVNAMQLRDAFIEVTR